MREAVQVTHVQGGLVSVCVSGRVGLTDLMALHLIWAELGSLSPSPHSHTNPGTCAAADRLPWNTFRACAGRETQQIEFLGFNSAMKSFSDGGVNQRGTKKILK